VARLASAPLAVRLRYFVRCARQVPILLHILKLTLILGMIEKTPRRLDEIAESGIAVDRVIRQGFNPSVASVTYATGDLS
jgi:hypothetical protein